MSTCTKPHPKQTGRASWKCRTCPWTSQWRIPVTHPAWNHPSTAHPTTTPPPPLLPAPRRRAPERSPASPRPPAAVPVTNPWQPSVVRLQTWGSWRAVTSRSRQQPWPCASWLPTAPARRGWTATGTARRTGTARQPSPPPTLRMLRATQRGKDRKGQTKKNPRNPSKVLRGSGPMTAAESSL